MSIQSTDIWESHDANPLLWMAMAGLALVGHLALLQAGISAYQAQVGLTESPKTETRIFASALQVASAQTPPPPQLEAETVTPLAAINVTSVQPSRPVMQSLSATVKAAPVAQEVAAPKPTVPAPPPSAPLAVAPAPISQVPLSPRPNQAGVSAVAIAPVQSMPATQAETVNTSKTLSVANIDTPTVMGTEPVPEILKNPDSAQTLSPLPDVASSLAPQPGVASAIAPTQTAEQAQDTYETVLDFLRGFDGGPCFAALPVLAEDGAFRFETFANSRADLTRFRQALEIETGSLPGTVMKPVSDAQCQALPFVTAAARYPEFQLYFDLSAREIPSGATLSGKLGNTSGGFVSLLLIDDEGVVQDLGSFLKFRSGYAGFDIPMTLKGSPVETQQLLMALSTRARLKTLQSLSGQPAADVFQRLAVEIVLQGGGEDVALVAFTVR